MSTRTITETIEQTRIVKLSWRQIRRERHEYPHEPFMVYALMQSRNKMLGYVLKDGEYWCCYEGDQHWAMTTNITVSHTLEEAKEKLMKSFADD